MKRLMITGANGQLGTELRRQAEGRYEIWAGDADALDIGDSEAVQRQVGEFGPDVIINAAAYTAVDKAESEPELAHRINVDGPRHLAEACADTGSRLVHVSTDFVFDGRSSTPYPPDAPTNPLGVYGQTKRDGELAVMEALPEATTIIRTAWVWGAGGHNFVKTMLRLLSTREGLGVVMDQIGTPTCTTSLSGALLSLVDAPCGHAEIFHWTDGGVASWYDFAVAIREEAVRLWPKTSWGGVVPIYAEDFPATAARPHYSVLDCRALQKIHGVPEHWRAVLRAQIRELGCGTKSAGCYEETV